MHEQGAEAMVANRSQVSDGLYMTEEQYLALDEATDGKYERLNGMVTMLRPPVRSQAGAAGYGRACRPAPARGYDAKEYYVRTDHS